jgi:hypothetical protein
MNRFAILVLLAALAILLTATKETNAQEAGGTVSLTVRLRAVNGEPIVDEPIVLQRLPDEDAVPPACRTDATGACTWPVVRGLYQVVFERPPDGVSALALAEGGLRGFGLTVGGEDIAYHFTFHDDGRVYFDAAPEADRPVPIIPTPELLMGGIAPTTTPEPGATAGAEPAAAPEGDEPGGASGAPADTEAPAGRTTWRFVLYLVLGLTAGGGLHLYSRRRQTRRGTDQTTDRRDDYHA